MLGAYAVLNYVADGITLPDDTDVAVPVDAARVDADELMHGPSRDAAAAGTRARSSP